MGDFQIMLVMPVVCLAAYGLLALLLVPMLRGNSRYLGLVALVGQGMTAAFLLRLWSLWRLSGPQETAFGMQ